MHNKNSRKERLKKELGGEGATRKERLTRVDDDGDGARAVT
jgi:hypothetical protein